VDKCGIEQASLEAIALQEFQPDFAESELRAAKAMLRMLHFDREITNPDSSVDTAPINSSSSSSSILWGRIVDFNENSYPKLNKEIVQLCQSITEAISPAATTTLKRQLIDVSGSMERFYEVVRYYKWSKTFCTWLYSEAQISSKTPMATYAEDKTDVPPVAATRSSIDVDFYGLRPQDSKSSAYIIRTLHKDFDAVTGRTTGMMQAALSNIDSDETVLDVIHHIERLTVLDSTNTSSIDEDVSKTVVSSPARVTRSPKDKSPKSSARSEQRLLYHRSHVTHFKVSMLCCSMIGMG